MKIEEIIANAPKGLSKNYMMRYLYLELGKMYRRDISFFYGTNSEKIQIYNQEINPNDENNRDIICKSIGKIYEEVFKRAGIKATCISKADSKTGSTSPFPHVDMIVEGEEGKKYYMNPMDDLYRIQMGAKTRRFGTRTDKYDGLDYFEEDEIKKMDDALGYTYNGMYMDEVFEMIRKEFLDRSKMKAHILNERPDLTNRDLTKDFLLEYKLDFIFDYINYGKDMRGYIELSKYYKDIFGQLLNKTERSKIKKYNICHKDRHNKDTMQAAMEVKLGDKTVYYVVSNGSNEYKKMTPIEFIRYMENGEWKFLKERRDDPNVEK